ncbi:PAS domain-containing protein [Magnetococcales bacterium HHB-1]
MFGVICNPKGQIIRILRDDLALFDWVRPKKNLEIMFTSILEVSEISKFHIFQQILHKNGAAYNFVFNILYRESFSTFRLAGIKLKSTDSEHASHDAEYLIAGAFSEKLFGQLFSQLLELLYPQEESEEQGSVRQVKQSSHPDEFFSRMTDIITELSVENRKKEKQISDFEAHCKSLNKDLNIFKESFDCLPIAFAIFDESEVLIHANIAFCRICHMSADELTGLHLEQLFQSEDADNLLLMVDNNDTHHHDNKKIDVLRRTGGKSRSFHAFRRPIGSEDKKYTGSVVWFAFYAT